MKTQSHAIILAAGRGSRLGTITQDHPKCLTRLGGQSLLDWQLEALQGAGAESIGIVTGYLAEMLERPGLTRFNNPRWSETNMVVSLMTASRWLHQHVCLVSYADIVYSADAVRRLMSAPGDIVLTYDPDWSKLWSLRFEDPLSDAETFKIDNDGRLLEIGGQADSLDEVQGQFMGLLKFTPEGWRRVERFLDALPQSQQDRLDMTGLLGQLLAQNVHIQTTPINDRWFEVDNPNDLAIYERLIGEGSSEMFRWPDAVSTHANRKQSLRERG